jgi:hypothetical protein
MLSHIAGANRALVTNQSYLSSTISRGALRNPGMSPRGQRWGFAAAVATIVGAATTLADYATDTGHTTVQTRHAEARRVPPGRHLARVGPLAGLPIAQALWLASLPRVKLDRIGAYGLIPLLPLTFWVALAVLLLSFSVLVSRATTATPILVAHVLTLVAILHATPPMLYGTLRYTAAWKHVGLIDFFMRHNGVDLSLHDTSAFQYWPAFFNINAMLVKAGGLQTSVNYAVWAQLFFNVILIGPLFLIFRTSTGDRRLVWSAIVIFFLGAWLGQDYFAPQACAYVLYLTVVALCLRYLGRKNDVPARHRRLLVGTVIIPMMAAIIPTHQLTPLAVVCNLGVLAVFFRYRVWLLMLLMIGLLASWDLTFAGPWFAENRATILGSIGTFGTNVDSGLTKLTAFSHSQAVVAMVDRAHTAALGMLALVGFARLFRSRSELTMPLLAGATLPLMLVSDYGGEIIYRAYLFALPFLAFCAAAAFFPREVPEGSTWRHRHRRELRGARLALPIVLLLLVPGFVCGYYGREQANYFSPQEVSASRFLYATIPRGSLIIGMNRAFPWSPVNIELYDNVWWAPFGDEFPTPYYNLTEEDHQQILVDPESMFGAMMDHEHRPVYLVFSKAQQADAETQGTWPPPGDKMNSESNLPPPGLLAQVEETMLNSPKFTVIYRNSDAVIFTRHSPPQEDAR